MSSTDTPFDNSDDSVFKTHVLYVIPGDANCTQIENALAQHPLESTTWIQDVRKLRPPLPQWLKGVPTLVCKQEGQVHMGENISRYLQSTFQGAELLPSTSIGTCTGTTTASTGAASVGSSLFAAGTFSLEYENSVDEIPDQAIAQAGGFGDGFASFTGNGVFNLEDENSNAGPAPSSMVQASAQFADAQHQNNATPRLAGRQGRRSAAQEEQAMKLQSMRDQRDALDRRFNPNPGFQRQ